MTDENSDIQKRLTAGLADKYAIESKLGEGGMALVYLATDIKHGRKVAVKVLRPELAASLGPERFLREIQLTAALSHPHILPLYDSGEADGFLYYVMPYVEGESLDAMLKREQQLSIPDAVRITREVAEALAVAHSRGLIHRDIKPDNILMTGGHAMVADFGIARAVEEAGGEKLTQTGMAIGTPAYMSPEQALGESNIDGRSDVYSLGCVLYELLVGDVPFTGPTPMAVLARHTMDNLTAPSIMRQSVPEELEDVLYCAMAKTPADRFKSAGEMAEALAALETGGLLSVRQTAAHVRQTMSHTRPTRSFAAQEAPAWRRALIPAGVVGALAVGTIVGWQLLGGARPAVAPLESGLDPRRIAIMYFDDLSNDSALGYVADGLTESLIDRLSTVSEFNVVSRNGVEPFRGTAVSRDSIARVLETGSIITGTIESEGGGQLRVTTRLVEGESGADIDRASFVLPAENLLVGMDSVSEAVARFLRTRLGQEIRLRTQREQTVSVEAWGLTQRAERLQRDAEEIAEADPTLAFERLESADSILQLAMVADPDWTEPVLAKGWGAFHRGPLRLQMLPEDRSRWFEAAAEQAELVLSRKPGWAEALMLRGAARFRLYRIQAPLDPQGANDLLMQARSDLEAAVRADPGLAEAQIQLSYLYYDLDEIPLAQLAARAALERDPYLQNADDVIDRLFWSSYDLEQLNQARNWCAQGAQRFAADYRFTKCQLWLMASPAMPPDPDHAWDLRGALDSLAPEARRMYDTIEAEMLIGGVLGRAGLVDSARAVLSRARNSITHDADPEQELLTREAYARSYLADEDKDEAITLLLQYKAAHPDHGFEEAAGTMWYWRELRARPRFSEVTNR